MPAKIIDLEDIGPIHLYKRRGVRAIKLSIGHDGKVRLTLPYWLPYKSAIEFAATRKDWIKSNRPISSRQLAHSDPVGKTHTMYFQVDPARAQVGTRITKDRVVVSMPAGLSDKDTAVQAAAHKAALRALKKQAEELLIPRLNDLAYTNDFTFHDAKAKQLKTRWGSCDSNKIISLNIFLVQLPWHLIDYVLLHELTHTKFMNHGPDFWQELERYIPEAKAIRKEMRGYRAALATV